MSDKHQNLVKNFTKVECQYTAQELGVTRCLAMGVMAMWF